MNVDPTLPTVSRVPKHRWWVNEIVNKSEGDQELTLNSTSGKHRETTYHDKQPLHCTDRIGDSTTVLKMTFLPLDPVRHRPPTSIMPTLQAQPRPELHPPLPPLLCLPDGQHWDV